jgi:hypothetical protein
MEYLFLYGTLMRNFPENPFRLLLERNTSYIGEAYTYGKLFLVDYYPALVSNSAIENHKVYGEVVRIENNTDLLEQLDEYEDYFPENVIHSLYIRKLTECFLIGNKESVKCNAYFYNKSVKNLIFLRDGHFFLS